MSEERLENAAEQEAYLKDEVYEPLEQELSDAGKQSADAEKTMEQTEQKPDSMKRNRKKSRGNKPKRTIMGNRVIQVLAHIMFLLGALLSVAYACVCVWMFAEGMFSVSKEQFYSKMMEPIVYGETMELRYYLKNDNREGIQAQFDNTNLYYILKDSAGATLLKYEGFRLKSICEYEYPFYYEKGHCTLTIGISGEWKHNDIYKYAYSVVGDIYAQRCWIPVQAVAVLFSTLLLLYFLIASAGYRNGKEGITPFWSTSLHLEVVTAVYFFAFTPGFIVLGEYRENDFINCVLLTAVILLWEFLCAVGYLREVAVRWKLKVLWKNTLVCWIWTWFVRFVKWIGRIFGGAMKGIFREVFFKLPMVVKTCVVLVFLIIIELFALLIFGNAELFVLWFIEKLIIIPIGLYLAIICKQLSKGAEALAEGQVNYKVDTGKMFGDFELHGENLNQISQGIAKAVEERTKSERMKTELITNVSHDIKTPLTSIINYADLIVNEPTDNNNIKDYSEVLLRQSKRLKKLLDDLLEASKATTGTLECHFVPCEIGVLLTQAVGEYEQRFAERNLELIMNRPEESLTVLADGEHMWRVFDNLLNNACKYSQEHSRVYLSMQKRENQVEIIFRNMSSYALNISPEELEERFVRGDKSRNMEGNGLGLSITRSLVELQNGTMQLVIDGDLFKVILSFDLLPEGTVTVKEEVKKEAD